MKPPQLNLEQTNAKKKKSFDITKITKKIKA